MLRRSFLQAAAGIGFAAAAPPPDAPPRPVRLGFDTYSLRAFNWKAMRLLDYAASRKLDTMQISSLGDFESLDPAHLKKVKDRAAELGIALDGGMGCICPLSYSWKASDGDPVGNIGKGLNAAQ